MNEEKVGGQLSLPPPQMHSFPSESHQHLAFFERVQVTPADSTVLHVDLHESGWRVIGKGARFLGDLLGAVEHDGPVARGLAFTERSRLLHFTRLEGEEVFGGVGDVGATEVDE